MARIYSRKLRFCPQKRFRFPLVISKWKADGVMRVETVLSVCSLRELLQVAGSCALE
jgi:hypothetical protein